MYPPLVMGYLALTHVMGPVYKHFLNRRLAQGKEHPNRMNERFGHTAHARPPGRLVWFHAASVGESLSLEPGIKELLKQSPDLSVMVTSGTVQS